MKLPIITRPSNSRTGKLQWIDQSNALYAQPRTLKRPRRRMNLALLLSVILGIAIWFVAGIARGLPVVLVQHGVL